MHVVSDFCRFHFTEELAFISLKLFDTFFNFPKTKKPENVMLTGFYLPFSGLKVVWEGIEPPTQRFSVFCSTDWATAPIGECKSKNLLHFCKWKSKNYVFLCAIVFIFWHLYLVLDNYSYCKWKQWRVWKCGQGSSFSIFVK